MGMALAHSGAPRRLRGVPPRDRCATRPTTPRHAPAHSPPRPAQFPPEPRAAGSADHRPSGGGRGSRGPEPAGRPPLGLHHVRHAHRPAAPLPPPGTLQRHTTPPGGHSPHTRRPPPRGSQPVLSTNMQPPPTARPRVLQLQV